MRESMVGMQSPSKAKYRYLRWGWLLLVVLDVLNAPRSIKGMIAVSSEDHRIIPLIPIVLALALLINWWWLKLWWYYRPSNSAHYSN
jgi:hypothetical protein